MPVEDEDTLTKQPWWEHLALQAIAELDDADVSSVRDVSDEHLARAMIYAILSCAAAIAEYPAGEQAVRSTGP